MMLLTPASEIAAVTTKTEDFVSMVCGGIFRSQFLRDWKRVINQDGRQRTRSKSTCLAKLHDVHSPQRPRNVSLPIIMSVVLPGDQVTALILPPNHDQQQQQQQQQQQDRRLEKLRLGSGLHHDRLRHQISAQLAGRLVQPSPHVRPSPPSTSKNNSNNNNNSNTWYIQQNIHRYRPMVDDRVLAIVEDRLGPDGAGGDLYRMNIVNGSHPAVLSNLEFEGATKRNKPALVTGMLLYARVVSTGVTVATDPTLSCMLGPRDVGLPRKDWMTNEGTYGELKGGTVCRISLGLARELMHPDNLVVRELATRGKLAFELCVGVNGLLWIHSGRPETTIMIQNAIRNSEVLTEEQVRSMVKKLVDTMQRQMQTEED